MKRIINVFIIIIISLFASSLMSVRPDPSLISTLYTVSGIMFSIGLGLIVTFNMNGVKNKSYIVEIRKNLNSVRNSFLFYFSLSTIAMIITLYTPKNDITLYNAFSFDIVLNYHMTMCLFVVFSILFFIINFLDVQKLNQDLFDELNKE